MPPRQWRNTKMAKRPHNKLAVLDHSLPLLCRTDTFESLWVCVRQVFDHQDRVVHSSLAVAFNQGEDKE